MDAVHRRIVENIRGFARQRGVAVTNLPERARVGRSHFWEVMAGRRSPTVQWLVRVAAALEVDVAALFREQRGPRART